MGFLDFFFKKPEKLNDDFFGQMLFIDWRNEPEKNYFECKRHFVPSDNSIDLIIHGDASGPTQKQKDFFIKIEAEYDVVIRTTTPMIEDQFRNWKEDFRIKDFRKEFEPVHINIPRCEEKDIEWEIAFTSIHDLNHHFTFEMKNWEAVSLLIDG